MCAVIIGRVASTEDMKTDIGLAARLAALASLGAAVIHFAVVPTHWHDWIPSGLFFVAIASFQLVWAREILVRPVTSVLAAGVVLNVGAVALWALSRTAGAPFGPQAGEPELVQAADLCAFLLQIYVVMGAGWVWYRGREAQLIPAFVNAAVLLGFSAVIASAATLGAASGLRHDHHAQAGSEPTHHTSTPGDGEGHHEHSAPPMGEAPHPLNAPAPVEVSPPAVHSPHGEGDHPH